MSSQICLRWNSFLNNIATSFESLWEEEGLVDVTLASDGQCLTAHKVILSASSPFFKKVFQTNPCQHPVIILQDVHFSELEALLIFIYKGEVNIEQKNLPALLKAAETLQIRGLSGGDIFGKESFKQLAELDQTIDDDAVSVPEEQPQKKQKTSRTQNSSILEKALTPRISYSEAATDSNASDKSSKESDCPVTDTSLPDEVYQRLEMKMDEEEFLKKGQTFESLNAFLSALCKHEDSCNQRYTKVNSKIIQTKDEELRKTFKLSNVHYKCKLGGEYTQKGQGIRVSRTIRIGCPAYFKAKLNRERNLFEITEANLKHTHGRIKDVLKHYTIKELIEMKKCKVNEVPQNINTSVTEYAENPALTDTGINLFNHLLNSTEG